jgi:hypothetical protein
MWMEARELDELELRQRIQAGIEAADELKERLARLDQEQSRERPKLRLIKGGAVAVALFAGVEWLRGYRRATVGVLASTAAAGGIAYLAPSIPDPPRAEMDPPARHLAPSPRPPTPTVSVAPSPTPRSVPPTQAKASPPRTSPLRTQVPVQVPTGTPTKTPTEVPIVSLPVTPTITVPVTASPSTPCTINLLGVQVCLPLG